MFFQMQALMEKMIHNIFIASDLPPQNCGVLKTGLKETIFMSTFGTII